MKTAFKKIVFPLAVIFCASCIAFADWNQGDPYKMHFPQMPNPNGWDICLHEQMVADDFQCTATGPITDIHFWVSWQSDVVDWQSTTFTVQIWSNMPGGPCGGGMPGVPLWTWNGQGNFVIRLPPERGDQGWHCPATGLTLRPDHQYYWQINITGIPQPFTQQQGATYWLVIKANKMDWPPAVGWKTSLNRFQSCALWSTGTSTWMPVMIGTETVDQAFVIANHDPGVAPDFGDAPDPTYPTLLASNGARHNIVAGMFLGAAIDGEPDGQPTVNADGDDLAGIPDDEDGVTFSTPLIPGQAATVNVVASVAGKLDAWIDFNADGSWMQAGDQIAISMPLIAGNNAITFPVPATASSGMTYARFRFSSIGGLPPFGPAPDGEVEDYTVVIEQETPDPNVKYIQHPDLTPTGIDIRVDNGDGVTRHIADDFPCTTTGPITDVHFWGSWKNDEKGQINGFVISFYSDDPVGSGGTDPCNIYSKPDQLLWTRTFMPSEFTETMFKDLSPQFEWWWDPYFHVQNPNGDHLVWKYDINIDPVVAFRQQGSPTAPKVYWLAIEAWTPYQGSNNEFGWKTTREHWNDDAVFATGSNPPYTWNELRYPQGHPYYPESLDMAFVITTRPEPIEPESDLGDAPDSSNNSGLAMTAYPAAGVIANFPTVYLTGSPPFGPIHRQPQAVAWLGPNVTLENEADIGPDQDVINNIAPLTNTPDQDIADDGVPNLPLRLPHCRPTTFKYLVNVVNPNINLYANAWFDWNRDGDWDDTMTCSLNSAPEWAVQNQLLPAGSLPIGLNTVTSLSFRPWHPAGTQASEIWMRISLSEQPWVSGGSLIGDGGSGPANGYVYGETEDYRFVPDTNCLFVGQIFNVACGTGPAVNITITAAMVSKWNWLGKPVCWCCDAHKCGNGVYTGSSLNRVDAVDLTGIQNCWMKQYIQPGYCPCLDFNMSGRVDAVDLTILQNHWMKNVGSTGCL